MVSSPAAAGSEDPTRPELRDSRDVLQNEHGVGPATILAVRFMGVTIVGALLAVITGDTVLDAWSLDTLGVVAGAALFLIVAPICINQLAIALAPAITVRVVMALGPVLVFLLQLGEGRLRASGYSLAVIILYAVFAVLATWARRCPHCALFRSLHSWRVAGRAGPTSR